MNFTGFTLPEGAWLPPEIIYLMPYFQTLGQLKCSIVAIYHYLQVGGSEPLSLTDFERLTGMSRPSVVEALKSLTGETTDGFPQILERETVGQSYSYYPKIKFPKPGQRAASKDSLLADDPTSKESLLADDLTGKDSLLVGQLRESERKLNIKLINKKDSLTDSLNLTDSTEKNLENELSMLKLLRSMGIYLQTAQWIVKEFSEEFINRQIEYYQFALKANFAKGPGWLVTSIKENWPAPLGFQDRRNGTQACPECGGPLMNGAFLHNKGCPDE